MKQQAIIAWALGAVIVALFGGTAYVYYRTADSLTDARLSLAEATSTSATLETQLGTIEADKRALEEALLREQERNNSFEGQIRDLGGTIGKLDKLSKIDPELLQKYSKVYFLNDNYVPAKLIDVDEKYRANEDKKEQFYTEAWPFLEDLLQEAEDEGINIRIASSYRSFGTQAALKNGYTTRYGSGANAFSADQGYSEHQLGTTIDFTSSEIGGSLSGFEKTEAFEWLEKNAYRYGFVLSYPAGNTYYQFEPWHWRFVGRDLAEDLYDDEKSFYDLDQREIDTYLITLFD